MKKLGLIGLIILLSIFMGVSVFAQNSSPYRACQKCHGSGQCTFIPDYMRPKPGRYNFNFGNPVPVHCKSGKCSSCEYAPGRCRFCNGTGQQPLVVGYNCSFCSGTGTCQDCNGTGTCKHCGGRGYCTACGGRKSR